MNSEIFESLALKIKVHGNYNVLMRAFKSSKNFYHELKEYQDLADNKQSVYENLEPVN